MRDVVRERAIEDKVMLESEAQELRILLAKEKIAKLKLEAEMQELRMQMRIPAYRDYALLREI